MELMAPSRTCYFFATAMDISWTEMSYRRRESPSSRYRGAKRAGIEKPIGIAGLPRHLYPDVWV
jgi:hypothetical protein